MLTFAPNFNSLCLSKGITTGLFYGVMVALEFLVLSVVVRIRLEQQDDLTVEVE